MTSSGSAFPLAGCYKARFDLWRSASIELSIGPEITDPLVQTGVEAVLALLRADARTPTALLGSLRPASRTARQPTSSRRQFAGFHTGKI
jgi:hypothetical protein